MKKCLALLSIGIFFLISGCTTQTQFPSQTSIPPTITATEDVGPLITPDPALQTKDLTSFVDVWNSKDVQNIKSLYTDNARIFSQADLIKLENRSPVEVTVSDDLITSLLDAIPEDMKIHIRGDPIMVYDKLVAFTYRLEGKTDGYNATGLIRYEGEKIYQHVFLVSDTLTSNDSPAPNSSLNSTIG